MSEEVTLKSLIAGIKPLIVKSDKDDEMQLRGLLIDALTMIDENLEALGEGMSFMQTEYEDRLKKLEKRAVKK